MVLLYFVGVFASYLLVLSRENRRFPWRTFLIARRRSPAARGCGCLCRHCPLRFQACRLLAVSRAIRFARQGHIMNGEMKQSFATLTLCILFASFSRAADPTLQSLIDGFRLVEVASVADAMEQLYGQRAHMSHDMRPRVHDQVRRARGDRSAEERGAQGRRGGFARHARRNRRRSAGSVYVMVVRRRRDYRRIGGLMATAMKISRPCGRGDRWRGASAILPQIQRSCSFPSTAAASRQRRPSTITAVAGITCR